MAIPNEIRMIAQAVLDGDESAALALFDALAEVRAKIGTREQELWIEFLQWCPTRIATAINRIHVASLAELTSMRFGDLLATRGMGIKNASLVQGWLARNGLSMRMDSKLARLMQEVGKMYPDLMKPAT